MSLKYEIALINVFWEEEDIDTRFFESVEEQTNYFLMKASGKFSPLSNFPVNNNIDTKIVYKDKNGRDVRELVASNYAVVRRYNDETNEVLEYRYYFAYCRQDSGEQVVVSLSLDDIQTNYFKYKDYINTCEIKRAHLNRFYKEGDKYKFNNLTSSPLYLKEDLGEFPKRLISRKKLNIQLDFGYGESKLNKWLNENIRCWNYIFLRGDRTYNGFTFAETSPGEYSYGEAHVSIDTIEYETNILGTGGVICVPVYKTSNRIKTLGPRGPYIFMDNNSLNKFKEKNNDTSYYLSNKISLRPPFLTDVYQEGIDYDINDGDLVIYRKTTSDVTSEELRLKGCNLMYTDNKGNWVIIVNKSEAQFQTDKFSLSKKIEFTIDEIVGVERDFRLNPKLLSNDFFDFNITNGTAEGFTYDFQKISSGEMQLYYTETLTPDITKAYTRLNTTNLSGGYVYYGQSYKAFIGLLYSNDNSIPYDNDALQSMLANNKNYFIQNTFNRDVGLLKGLFGAGMSGAQGNYNGMLAGGYTSALDYYTSKKNQDYDVDNMRQAPSEIKNVNGNALFANDVSEMGIYVEEYEALPQSLESANDYMYQFGFKYNRLGNIGDFDNIRYYFNYIEASINIINAPISLDEKRRLKDRFNKGVRFWNSDTIQYDMENYERMLINNG